MPATPGSMSLGAWGEPGICSMPGTSRAAACCVCCGGVQERAKTQKAGKGHLAQEQGNFDLSFYERTNRELEIHGSMNVI